MNHPNRAWRYELNTVASGKGMAVVSTFKGRQYMGADTYLLVKGELRCVGNDNPSVRSVRVAQKHFSA